MNDGSSRFQLQSVAFFGRTLAEYLQMLALDQEGLRGLKILDVASGPGSFIAEALAMGLDATGCDPMYDGDSEAIVAQGKADIDACREQIRRNPGVLVYADIYREGVSGSLEAFSGDPTPTGYRRAVGTGHGLSAA